MADYQYLKENNLFEAHMKFMRAIGESFGYPIEEASDDDQDQQNDPMGAPGGAPGADPMGGGMPDPNAQGGAPGADPMGAPGGAPGADPMGGGMPDPNAQGGAPGTDPMGAPGADPMGGGMPEPREEDEPEEDEDVLDIDDLTDAQEKLNDKENAIGKDLGKVDSRIEKLIGAVETLKAMFDKNNQEIEAFKAEFEKRNPTQTERLNLRSLDSYPFVDKPTDYWGRKAETSNYSAYADNDEPTSQEYVITNSDVDDFSEREIADSFSLDDSINQDIKKIFGL